MRSPKREVAAALAGVLSRPRLWPAAATLVPPGWWRTWPPLPFPAGEYLRFRLETMYGDPDPGERGRFRAADLIEYLEWCRRMGVLAR